MATQEWPAKEYAIGSYIQNSVADKYFNRLKIKPTDKILDVGCGTGGYTQKIISKVPQGSVLGIDTSLNMLHIAEGLCQNHPNFTTKKLDVLNMHFAASFDYIVSFWCLQWTKNIQLAFTNMTHALTKKGKIFAIFPVGDDPFINGHLALKKTNAFPCLKHFKEPVDYSLFDNLAEQLEAIPKIQLQVELRKQSIILPSLDVYRKFVNGIGFYQGQIPDPEIKQINEALTQYF
ncbi:MAG: class I SAM-dependent methyltransferase, partial [bacterium]|nr:class I SAM-dependent methyltransferase [bacterium]